MENHSPWLRRLAVSATFVACIFTLGLSASRSNPVLAHSKAIVTSYSLLPGQSMNFANRKYHRVEVQSTFPIRVLSGPCHEENVVQFLCATGAGDIFVTDLRGKPLFRTPEANQVTITESKK